jgi:hypothetical protein
VVADTEPRSGLLGEQHVKPAADHAEMKCIGERDDQHLGRRQVALSQTTKNWCFESSPWML